MKIVDEEKDPRILIHVRVDRDIHAAMKEKARARMCHLGAVYEEAAERWLGGAIDTGTAPSED